MANVVDKGVLDLDGDAALREEVYARHIAPPQDGEFVRMTTPTLRGKLALVEGLPFEEIWIGFAMSVPRSSPSASCITAFSRWVWPRVPGPNLRR